MTVPLIIKGRRGEHRSSARRLAESDSHSNRAYRFCDVPTGDIGNYRFCTRVLIRIAVNIHRRTANGRPYVSTVLEHRIIVGASIARPLRTDVPTDDNGN